ncbi:uncharacterized protein LOC118738878 [Rhagoletis pomonella]|uniref:uncharacterized protein LOC118738878 n=1 Tax=Rhagoletis pomonella TaxID=28610 RepID=UPI00177ECB87|nr:uncharacterized protein LOC118738878 [Rhagoletis pomonella]
MSYTALLNTCNASGLAEQPVSKPNYTPGKALKKAYKLLRRVFKPSTTGKLIITAEKRITAQGHLEAAEKQHSHKAETSTDLNDSVLTTCSTLSAEEYENDLNELAELESAASEAISAE